jgi:hypothetical protein
METVYNLLGVAIPDIWGNKNSDKPQTCHIEAAGQEPVSGQTVDVKAGEHYDKGNADSESRTLHLFFGANSWLQRAFCMHSSFKRCIFHLLPKFR